MRTTVALFILVIITIYYYQKARKVIKQKFKKMKTKHFKVKELPQVTEPNSIYFVKPDGCDAIAIFTTDKDGNAFQNKEIKSITVSEDAVKVYRQLRNIQVTNKSNSTVTFFGYSVETMVEVSGYVKIISGNYTTIYVKLQSPGGSFMTSLQIKVYGNNGNIVHFYGKFKLTNGINAPVVNLEIQDNSAEFILGSTIQYYFISYKQNITKIELYDCHQSDDVNTGSYSGSGSIIGNL